MTLWQRYPITVGWCVLILTGSWTAWIVEAVR